MSEQLKSIPTPVFIDAMPVGVIMGWLHDPNEVRFPPGDWLLCDGSPIPDRYRALRDVLGSTTLPNLIGRVQIGAGDLGNAVNTQMDHNAPNFAVLTADGQLPVGFTGGECAHTLNVEEMPSHGHTINGGAFGYHQRSFAGKDGTDKPFVTEPGGAKLSGTDGTGSSKPHYNVQPYMAVKYIIFAGMPNA